MLNPNKIKFLFKCDVCEMIVSIDLEDKEEIEKVRETEMILDCQCGGECFVLRD